MRSQLICIHFILLYIIVENYFALCDVMISSNISQRHVSLSRVKKSGITTAVL